MRPPKSTCRSRSCQPNEVLTPNIAHKQRGTTCYPGHRAPVTKYPLTVLLLDFHMAKNPMHMTRIKYRATMAMSAVSRTALMFGNFANKCAPMTEVSDFYLLMSNPSQAGNHNGTGLQSNTAGQSLCPLVCCLDGGGCDKL